MFLICEGFTKSGEVALKVKKRVIFSYLVKKLYLMYIKYNFQMKADTKSSYRD